MLINVGHYGHKYICPSYTKLQTTLLKKVKYDLIKELDVVKQSWVKTRSIIMCDI
jgi:hypothetical protein